MRRIAYITLLLLVPMFAQAQVAKQVEEFNVLDKFYGKKRISIGGK